MHMLQKRYTPEKHYVSQMHLVLSVRFIAQAPKETVKGSLSPPLPPPTAVVYVSCTSAPYLGNVCKSTM